MREMHALTISQHHDSNKLTEKSQIASFLCGWIFPQQVIRLVTNHRRTPGDTNEDNEYKLFGKTSLNRNWAQRRFCLVCFKSRLKQLQYHFGLIWFLENGQNQGINGNIGQYWQKVSAGKKWETPVVCYEASSEGAGFVSGGVLSFSGSGEQCVTFDQRQRSSDSDHCYVLQYHITHYTEPWPRWFDYCCSKPDQSTLLALKAKNIDDDVPQGKFNQ